MNKTHSPISYSNDELAYWQQQVQQAKLRPAMFIGNQQNAHCAFVTQALKLFGQAKAFNHPKSATVYLSPNQYIVRCEAGPLLQPIERLYRWENKHILTSGWEATTKKLRQEYQENRLEGKRNLRTWRRYFGCPTGPTLDSPTYPAIFAKRFVYAYRISSGFRGQSFHDGLPTDDPFLIEKPASPIGLLIAAELSKEWFPGLPFTEADAAKFSNTKGVSSIWHSQNDWVSSTFDIISLL